MTSDWLPAVADMDPAEFARWLAARLGGPAAALRAIDEIDVDPNRRAYVRAELQAIRRER